MNLIRNSIFLLVIAALLCVSCYAQTTDSGVTDSGTEDTATDGDTTPAPTAAPATNPPATNAPTTADSDNSAGEPDATTQSGAVVLHKVPLTVATVTFAAIASYIIA
ncbi:uncharacterized protein LOC100186991 [Ciona intestinalis]